MFASEDSEVSLEQIQGECGVPLLNPIAQSGNFLFLFVPLLQSGLFSLRLHYAAK